MKKENLNIDEFFKESFSDHKIENEDLSWFDIDAKVTRNNFMRFSLYSFNIYYIVFFIISVLITSYVNIFHFRNQNSHKEITAPVKREIYIPDTVFETKVEYKIIEKQVVVRSDDHIDHIEKTENINDHEKIIANKNIDSLVEVNQVEIFDTVKNIIVIKPAVIEKRDTVIVKSKSNKKRIKFER